MALRSRHADALPVDRGTPRRRLPRLPRYQERYQDYAGDGLLWVSPAGRRAWWRTRPDLRAVPRHEFVQTGE
jgi:hypothetical protein